MSTIPSSRSAAAPSRMPQRQSSAPGSTVAIDPIKVVKKYLWFLIASGVLGAVVGVGAYFALLKVAPSYKARVVFEAFQPQGKVGINPETATVNKDELERYMETQIQVMTSERILDAVVNNPAIRDRAPDWHSQFRAGGGFDAKEALIDLEDRVRARVLRGTRLIELSGSWKNPAEVTAIVGLIKSRYIEELTRSHNQRILDERDQLDGLIRQDKERIEQLQTRRDRILADENVDSLNSTLQQSSLELRDVTEELTDVRMDLQALTDELDALEQQLSSPSGVTYPDRVRSAAEREPIVADVRRQISTVESEISRLRNSGKGPEHRQVKSLQYRLDSLRQHLNEKMEEAMRGLFDANVDTTRRTISQLRAQESELLNRKELTESRNNELTRIQVNISDLSREIDRLLFTVQEREEKLNDLTALRSGADSANRTRIHIIEHERRPKSLAFPRLTVFGPAGVLLVGGLAAGLVFLREVLDQRVRGASDLGDMPRGRLLGVVPDASEDPSSPERVETVFQDNPNSVLAESFRQVRGTFLRHMNQGGHKTLAVVGGMPDSGASSIIVNLAYAMAATDRRVLIIDANMRRPAIHRMLGLPEQPGLGGILAGERSFEDSIQSHDGIDLLAAGATEYRQIERLASDTMTKVLETARGKYDIVLVDVAPAVVSGDGTVLANKCDAAVLIARALRAKRGMIRRIAGELADAKGEFLGVLVNGVRAAAGGYLRRNIRATHEYHSNGDATTATDNA